nr:uncharacterized protein LOC109147704 [Ipomoea batatas]
MRGGGGNHSPAKSSTASSSTATSSEGQAAAASSAEFSPKSLEKHCRPIDDVIMEAEAKGTLIERLASHDQLTVRPQSRSLSQASHISSRLDLDLQIRLVMSFIQILMDSTYLNSSAKVNSVAGMDHDPIPALTEDGQGDTVATAEEDPSAALQLNRRRSRSFERNPPIGTTEVDADGVPESDA